MNGQDTNTNQNNLDNTSQLNVTQNIPQPVSDNTSQINVTQNINTNAVNNAAGVSQKTETNIPNNSSSLNGDTNNKKKSEYKPPSTFKMILLIIFFGGLVAFIMFLPEIQAFVSEQISGKAPDAELTSGKLICSLETNTANLDKSFERIFVFADKKLESAKFTTVTKGNITQDEETLNDLDNKCKQIKEFVYDIPGVSITCDYSAGLLTERESFDYKEYDKEKVKTAYTEAGVEVMEYDYGYDIDKIQTAMLQGGFTCKKER